MDSFGGHVSRRAAAASLVTASAKVIHAFLGGILQEINKLLESNNAQAFDLVRRKYLASLHVHTKRAVIVYASKWTQFDDDTPPNAIAISDEDMQGFMEAIYGLEGDGLDLILHSPGGNLEAADSIVQYLRSQFNHIRVFIPHAAMSAATMIALAADEIVMGKHSFLGPIDPQFSLHTALGMRMVPAQAILDQFEQAKVECADPEALSAWLPILQQYGPDLLPRCKLASNLSAELAEDWLGTYMFKGSAEGLAKAKEIAQWLSKHEEFKSHSRHISRETLRAHGVPVTDLEQDKISQDFVLSIFHAFSHTFTSTGVVKIIENHVGSAYVKQLQKVLVGGGMPMPMPMAMPAKPAGNQGQPHFKPPNKKRH